MHLKSHSSEKKWFFYRTIGQNLLVEKYRPQHQVFLYQGMVYIFETCNIVFKKTETPESRQIESQDCLKFANFIV
jgi:hypothetical protein